MQSEATLLDTLNSEKRVVFETEQQSVSCSTRKKYFMKSKIMHRELLAKIQPSKSNIFDLTNNNVSNYSEVGFTDSSARSRLYTNSLISSPSKSTLVDNPENKITLPIITESKYNFKPKFQMPKTHKSQILKSDPFYIQNSALEDKKNMRKHKKYQKLWAESSQLRSDKSILEHSLEKADKYLQNHNRDFRNKRLAIDFQTILRDRHIKQQQRLGFQKGIVHRKLAGLVGKGGSVGSLYEQVYVVQQVYKIDKGK